jgi:ribonucleoside-diphosphate reductase alpha chain
MTLPTDYQTFIHKSRYAKWLDEEDRREDWEETVARYMRYVVSPVLPVPLKSEHPDVWHHALSDAIENLEVMPSMRALMTAGKAFDRDNTCGYNCAYLPVNSPRAFDETMHILLCGTGVGFSVE